MKVEKSIQGQVEVGKEILKRKKNIISNFR